MRRCSWWSATSKKSTPHGPTGHSCATVGSTPTTASLSDTLTEPNRGASDSAGAATLRERGFRMPAEWEPHRGTWLSWPHNEASWPGLFERIPDTFAQIVRELAVGEEVHIKRLRRRDGG